jgi:predicted permease
MLLLWLQQALQDVRYATRSLAKTKVFAAVAILTLALGIGANTAIFSIINTVLLHPLAYPDAARLVAISSNNLGSGITIVSFTKFSHLQAQSRTLERVGAVYSLTMNVTTRGAPEQVPGAHGSLDLFLALGVSPALGRGFLPEEDQPGGRDVALVTDAFWRNHLGADANVIGTPISIDGRSTTIVGVLPVGFRFPFVPVEPQVWLPRVFENPNYPPDRIRAGVVYLFLLGKTREGQPLERIQAEMDKIASHYRMQFPHTPDASAGLTVATLESTLVANVRASLLALLAAVGFVLLIACVNVANLLLARATGREKEIAIRRALGAARGRLTRQLLTESLVLSFLGGSLGVLLAAACLPALIGMVKPGTIPLSDLVHLDRSVLLFALVICCATGLFFGLVPALQASKQDLNSMLKEGSRGSTVGGGRLRQLMVVSEVALTLMLMTGAGLLIKSVVNLMNVNPGFVSGDVMTFSFNLPQAQYTRPSQRTEFCRQLLAQVRTLPGVHSVRKERRVKELRKIQSLHGGR